MDYSICKIVGEDEISATEEKKSISRESAGFFLKKKKAFRMLLKKHTRYVKYES